MGEPLRVLQVIGSMNRGGAENLIMNLYRNIDRSKVQFDFLVCTKEKADFDDEIISLGGKIYRELEYLNAKSILKYKSLCNNFFAKHNYKIVHCHIESVAAFVLEAAKKQGAVTIAHSHLADADFAHKVLFKKIPGVSDYLFACSKEAALSRYGSSVFEKDNFKLINNSIEAEKFVFSKSVREKIRKELSAENDFVIGHVGRFYEQKNHSFILDIFKEISLADKTAKLILAGKGELEDDIKKKARDLQLSDRVVFLGLVDNPEELFNAFDFFLFPSLFEGLPLSVVEAQTNGLKCLLSDAISPDTKITDLVEFYSLENSAADWAKKILSYKNYEHKDTLSQIKSAGYDASRQAKELEKFYLEKA